MPRKSKASKAGSALVLQRWKKATKKQREEHARMMAEERWKNATKEERSQAAAAAANARWKGKKKNAGG